jgi:hypothetical protein
MFSSPRGTAIAVHRPMADSTPVTVQPLSQRMETLAAFEPSPFPVISLYLSPRAQPERPREPRSVRAQGLQRPREGPAGRITRAREL